MRMLFFWLLVTYCALKFGSMARASGPGFRRADIGLWDRLRAREPALLLIAVLIAVPPVMVEQWYAHRTLTRQYETSVTCYGQMAAFLNMPPFKDDLSDFAAYEAVQQSKAWAAKLGGDLRMKPREVGRALIAKVQFFSAHYAELQRRGAKQELLDEMHRARQCLLPPDATRNSSS